jgi:hypothetical protein
VRRGRFFAAPALAVLAACSSPQALLGKGGQCLQTTECQDGLVCVQQTSGDKICSADLANIVSTEEAGAADARPPDGSVEGGEGGAGRDGGPADAAQPTDAGASPEARPAADSASEASSPADSATEAAD